MVFTTKSSIAKLADDYLHRVLPTARFPILQTYGAKDIYGTFVDEPRKRLPNATFELWDNVGHLPWLDDPKRFESSLRSFFS